MDTPNTSRGAAEETISGITGASSWQRSGTSDKRQGLDAMRAASADRDPQSSGFGKVEEVAGKVTGCNGMESEGAESRVQS